MNAWRGFLLVLVLSVPSLTVQAQEPPRPLDARLVEAVYRIDAPAFTAPMHAAHVVSVPVFIATPPALWLGTLAAGADLAPPTALSMAWLGTFGTVTLLKNTIRRPRPFTVLDDIERRGMGPTDVIDPFSFPSGHAGLAFTIATSLSASYPEWYVIAPAYVWATTTALSRVWHGVHYPSDIAVGALLGSGIALGAHALVNALTDEEGADPTALRSPPMVGVVLPIR
ncbi:MAG: phosphatase PAP2 family protein [Bacteroidota bacterium]